jgi:hypothetical protein
MTIASAAYRPWYLGRSELEHSAARKRNQPSPGTAGRSESLRNKRVRLVYSLSPQGNGWRCNACPNRSLTRAEAHKRARRIGNGPVFPDGFVVILCCGGAVCKCETSCGWHASTSLCRTETCTGCDSRSNVGGRLAMNHGLGRPPGVSGSSRHCDQEGNREKTVRKFVMSPFPVPFSRPGD